MVKNKLNKLKVKIMVWDDSMLGGHKKQLKWGWWEYIVNQKYRIWINILKPPQFIFELTENKFNIIISDDKNKPDNNLIKFIQDLRTGILNFVIINKYGYKLL